VPVTLYRLDPSTLTVLGRVDLAGVHQLYRLDPDSDATVQEATAANAIAPVPLDDHPPSVCWTSGIAGKSFLAKRPRQNKSSKERAAAST
jgi:hypothetical protein